MREALARIDNDFVLSEPRSRGGKQSEARGFMHRPKQIAGFMAKYANLFIALLFVTLLGTVLLNALVWQKSRHPAPLFGHSVAIEPKPEKDAEVHEVPVPAARPAVAAQAPAADPAPPPPHGRDPMAEAAELQAPPKAAPAPSHDPIAQLLKRPAAASTASTEPSKSLLSAQRALMKLGYVVKPDGVMRPATKQALEQFEREHNLPAHGALTPKVMHELAARSGMAVE